jgi:hypothetical protein
MLPTTFEGQTVFILGGGPSLTPDVLARVEGKPAIAINSTARLAPAAPVLYFADWGWFRDNRPIVDTFGGLVVTFCRRAWQGSTRRELILVGADVLSPGPATAGHHALEVAAAMGAARVVLLGFDCRTVGGRSHCHGDYSVQRAEYVYRDKIAPLWAGWGARMRARGLEVVNATAGSAITEFPMAELEAVL